MKVAALDLGSNTFLCLIAEVKKQTSGRSEITEVYSDAVEIVRLGEGVEQTKMLSSGALLRAEKCLREFKKIIDLQKPEKILAMATSAARDSQNRSELFEIGKSLQIPIEIIAGPVEAQITYQGATSGLKINKKTLVVDVGGGSTEFILGDLGAIEQSQSLNMGCVRWTEKYITHQPTPDEQVTTAENMIQETMQRLKRYSVDSIAEIIAVAGTPTALVAAQLGIFDAAKIEGFQLGLADLESWKTKLQAASVQEKIKMGLPQGRADVMLMGVLILIQTLKFFKKNQMTVSTRGVRHGIALEMAHRFLA